MSEYIEIVWDELDAGDQLLLQTTLRLTEGPKERYDSSAEMDEGSPLAQALARVGGLTALELHGSEMKIQRDLEWEWYNLIEDVRAVLREFFL